MKALFSFKRRRHNDHAPSASTSYLPVSSAESHPAEGKQRKVRHVKSMYAPGKSATAHSDVGGMSRPKGHARVDSDEEFQSSSVIRESTSAPVYDALDTVDEEISLASFSLRGGQLLAADRRIYSGANDREMSPIDEHAALRTITRHSSVGHLFTRDGAHTIGKPGVDMPSDVSSRSPVDTYKPSPGHQRRPSTSPQMSPRQSGFPDSSVPRLESQKNVSSPPHASFSSGPFMWTPPPSRGSSRPTSSGKGHALRGKKSMPSMDGLWRRFMDDIEGHSDSNDHPRRLHGPPPSRPDISPLPASMARSRSATAIPTALPRDSFSPAINQRSRSLMALSDVPGTSRAILSHSPSHSNAHSSPHIPHLSRGAAVTQLDGPSSRHSHRSESTDGSCTNAILRSYLDPGQTIEDDFLPSPADSDGTPPPVQSVPPLAIRPRQLKPTVERPAPISTHVDTPQLHSPPSTVPSIVHTQFTPQTPVSAGLPTPITPNSCRRLRATLPQLSCPPSCPIPPTPDSADLPLHSRGPPSPPLTISSSQDHSRSHSKSSADTGFLDITPSPATSPSSSMFFDDAMVDGDLDKKPQSGEIELSLDEELDLSHCGTLSQLRRRREATIDASMCCSPELNGCRSPMMGSDDGHVHWGVAM